MENLQNELTELQAREAALSAEWEHINSTPNVDVSRFNEVNAQLNTVREEIKEKMAEIAAKEAQEQVSGQFENIVIEGTTLTLREMCASSVHYQILSGWIQQYVGNLVRTHETVLASHISENDRLQEELTEMDTIRRRNFDLDLKCNDLEAKRDAAVAELESAQDEMKRLNTDNESLRRQLEATSKPINTNVSADLAELAKKLHDAKPAIYNKRWEDANRKTHFLANRADTGEEIRFGYLEAGQYREVSPEEAERFRAEFEAAQQAEAAAVVEENHADSPLVDYPKPPALPSDGLEMDEHAAVSTGDGTNFEAEVKRRLEMLELHVFGQSEVA